MSLKTKTKKKLRVACSCVGRRLGGGDFEELLELKFVKIHLNFSVCFLFFFGGGGGRGARNEIHFHPLLLPGTPEVP